MDPNWTGSTGNRKGSVKIQNFLEALRNSQTTANETNGLGIFGNKRLSAENGHDRETENKRIEQFQHQRNQEWNQVFSSKEIEREKKIAGIREQLQALSKQLKRLDINIQKAVVSPIVFTGEYQESFLEHLQNRIRLFSLKVNRANSWLELYQRRAKKQGVYWGMAKSKGSSYTQNNERSIATSIG